MSSCDLELWKRISGYTVRETHQLDRSEGPILVIKAERDLSQQDASGKFKELNEFGLYIYVITVNGHSSYVHEELYNYFIENCVMPEQKREKLQSLSQEQSRKTKKRKMTQIV